MKAFYGSRFSQNMTLTPEGFLICHNVPIARTGWYEYLRKELGLQGDPNEVVKVYRDPEEVFNKRAISSFEGKPVTDEHPPDLLTPENAQRYAKGTVQNVRQDKKETELLLADLIIYDKKLIEEVLDGKREVSCGYECTYVDNENGTCSQSKICGNHVAVVQAGRAGHEVSIKDSNKEMEGERKYMSKIKIPRKHSTTTKLLAAIGLKHFAMDADPEDIADVVDEMAEENKTSDSETEVNEKKETDSDPKECNDNENPAITELNAKFDKLTELVSKLLQPNNDENPEKAIDTLIDQLDSENPEEGSETIEEDDEDIQNTEDGEEETESTKNTDSAAMLKALRAIRPVIANIPDVNERKKACDSLMVEFKKANKTSKKSNGYSDILKSQRKKASDASQKQSFDKVSYNENLGENIMKKYNANCKEVK